MAPMKRMDKLVERFFANDLNSLVYRENTAAIEAVRSFAQFLVLHDLVHVKHPTEQK